MAALSTAAIRRYRFKHSNKAFDRLKAAIFDVDGTLLESMDIDCEIYTSAIYEVLGRVEFRPSFSHYENVTDVGIIRELMADNSLAIEAHVLGKIQQTFIARLRKHIRSNGPFPAIRGAQQAIDSLKSSNEYCIAIATGGWRDSAILKLETAGFDLAGIPIATCDDSVARAEIMQIALNKMDRKFDVHED